MQRIINSNDRQFKTLSQGLLPSEWQLIAVFKVAKLISQQIQVVL